MAAPRNRRGRIDHYFHFLLGYFLPVVTSLAPLRTAAPVVVRDCGPLTRHWYSVGRFTWVSLPAEEFRAELGEADVVVRQTGFDHPDAFHVAPWPRVRGIVRRMLGVADPVADGHAGRSPRILVVDRLPPDDYYADHIRGGGGSRRRHVPNLPEVAHTLAAHGDVHVVALESKSLPEQAQLFRDADVVVAQHGAALANLAWCRKGTHVVEMTHDPKAVVFGRLARSLGLTYAFAHQPHTHAPVEPRAVLRALDGRRKARRRPRTPRTVA